MNAKLRAVLMGIALLALDSAAPLHAAPQSVPGLISVPDYADAFTVFAAPRRNPLTLGNVTRDGYPLLPADREGFRYLLQPGIPVSGPLRLPGQPFPYAGDNNVRVP